MTLIVTVYTPTGKWLTTMEFPIPEGVESYETDKIVSYVAQSMDYHLRFKNHFIVITCEISDYFVNRLVTPKQVDQYYGCYSFPFEGSDDDGIKDTEEKE